MTFSLIIPGFLLGMAGSLHCIGMCGPLSLALPVAGKTAEARAFSVLGYQAGRISTYTLIGIICGVAGTGILSAGYQRSVSIIAGLIILLSAAGYFAGRKARRFSFIDGFHQFLNGLLFRLLNTARRPDGAFLFGMVNGLLPCGMVYVAAIASTALGSVGGSALFMLFFGAGTLPAMLLAAFAGNSMGLKTRRWMGRLSPYLIGGMGVLLIIRGLNLGIAYLSPAVERVMEGGISCHP